MFVGICLYRGCLTNIYGNFGCKQANLFGNCSFYLEKQTNKNPQKPNKQINKTKPKTSWMIVEQAGLLPDPAKFNLFPVQL